MNSILLLWFVSIFFVILLIKLLNIKKNTVICFFIFMSIIIFVVNINTSIKSVIEGCKLCLNSIIPTLFPFSVICNLLIQYDGILLFSKILGPLFCKPLKLSKSCSFSLAASFLCGYPLGARYATDLYELKYINKTEYIRLLNIATNCGPIFIIGTIGYSFLNDLASGYLLLIANYLSVIIMALITKKNESINSRKTLSENKNNINFGVALKTSIENALNTTLTVCGFILIFSIIISILNKNSINIFLLGTIEITKGAKLISMSSFTYPIKLGLISFLCSFSGLCIILQSASFFSKHNISIAKYTFLKFIQGIISFLITFIICTVYPKNIFTSNIPNMYAYKPHILILLIPTIAIILIYLLCKITKKLFFHIP